MTNELEKQFFDTFDIEPRLKTFAIKRNEQDELTYPPIYEYPQITDRILLELICRAHTSSGIIFVSRDVEKLKEEVLTVLCHWVNCRVIKQKVRTLFEEG